ALGPTPNANRSRPRTQTAADPGAAISPGVSSCRLPRPCLHTSAQSPKHKPDEMFSFVQFRSTLRTGPRHAEKETVDVATENPAGSNPHNVPGTAGAGSVHPTGQQTHRHR